MKFAGSSNATFLRQNRTAGAKSLALDTMGGFADLPADKTGDRILGLLASEGPTGVKSLVQKLGIGVSDALAVIEKLESFGFVKIEDVAGEAVVSKTPD